MGFLKLFAAFQAVCLTAQASPLRPAQVTERAVTWSTFSNVKIFGPGSGFTAPGVLYGRTAIINETLYATAENYNSGLPVSPIYKSQDAGKTWTHVTDVKDTVNGFGLTWEPDLYVLPTAIGSYPAGTLLLAIDSVPKSRSTYKIDIYASLDQGVTWKFVSNVAKGGAIYEPFMLAYQGQLIVYFSDNRDSRYSQKLTHVTSKDLVNWSATSDDVAGAQSDRPGMATVAALPNGQWIMTYENGISSGGGYNFPVYYKIASSPLSFNSVQGKALVANNGAAANAGSPYVVWSSTGGSSGTVVVSFAGSGNLFTSKSNGASGSWTQLNTNVPAAYSRSIRVLPDPTKLLIVGAGFNGNTMNSAVRADVVNIS